MSILSNKRGLIFGAVDQSSLAWHVALACKQAGADVVLSNTAVAIELGAVRSLAEEQQMPLIACDATHPEEIEHLLAEAQQALGGQLDFVLHAVAQSQNLAVTSRMRTPITTTSSRRLTRPPCRCTNCCRRRCAWMR